MNRTYLNNVTLLLEMTKDHKNVCWLVLFFATYLILMHLFGNVGTGYFLKYAVSVYFWVCFVFPLSLLISNKVSKRAVDKILRIRVLTILSSIFLLYSMYKYRYFPNQIDKFYFFSTLIISVPILLGILWLFFWKEVRVFKKEIILFSITVLVMFVALEVISRTWVCAFGTHDQIVRYASPEECGFLPRFSPQIYPHYILTKNYVSLDGLNRHNSLGYRGEEISMPKPKDVFRIVAIGGSNTYGHGISDYKNAYPYQLQEILQAKYRLKNVEVINAGVPGAVSHDTLVNLVFRILYLTPDIILDYDGFNDVLARIVPYQNYTGDSLSPINKFELKTPFYFEKSVLVRIVTGLNPPVFRDFVFSADRNPASAERKTKFFEYINGTQLDALRQNKPVFFERNLESMYAIAKQFNITFVVSTLAYTDQLPDDWYNSEYDFQGIKEHTQIIRAVARKNNIPMFDFEKVMPKDAAYWFTSIHENEQGARKRAELYADFLYKNFLSNKHLKTVSG